MTVRLVVPVLVVLLSLAAAGFFRAQRETRADRAVPETSSESPSLPAASREPQAPVVPAPIDTGRFAVAPARPQSAPVSDEGDLMKALRAESDPGRVVALAREGNRRFGDSTDAPERTSLLIHALAKEGHDSEARGEAETMVNSGPDSTWIREIEQFTGAHRHRNLRLNDAGLLEFY